MGIPVESAQPPSPVGNPAGTLGLAFVEFSAPNPEPIARLFTTLGFVRRGISTKPSSSFWRQGDVTLVLNGDPNTHGGGFAAKHGPSICAIAFRMRDAKRAFERATSLGATPYAGPDRKSFEELALNGIGGSLLYLVDDSSPSAQIWRNDPKEPHESGVGVIAIDHLTHNVRTGGLEQWADFYSRIFGFREVFYLTAQGAATGFRTRALKSPCNGICIPINEPTDPKSQIQEYIDAFKGEGVQHVALASANLADTIERLRGQVPFMSIPESYYSQVDTRLPGHGEDVERLKRNGILIDGTQRPDGAWDLLLQIFSKNLVGPTFLEFIQRKGNEGFGEGNAKALFEAIERDQIERGVVRV